MLPYTGNVRSAMSRVQSVERAIALLSAIAAEPSGLVNLAEAVELPTTTAARLLATLEGVDAVRRDDDGTYRIGSRIISLASADDFEPTLKGVAHPHMTDLVGTLDEAIGMSITAGSDVVTIAQVDAPRPVQAEDWTGSRWPMHQGGTGLVVLATYAKEDVDAYLDKVPEAGSIRERIDEIRARGVGWSHGEYVEELSSVGVALVDSAGVGIGTIYAYGPSYRFPGERPVEEIEAAVREKAGLISGEWNARTRTRPTPPRRRR